MVQKMFVYPSLYRSAGLFICLFFYSFGALGQQSNTNTPGQGTFVAGRVLVKFRSGVTESQIHGVLGAHMGWSQKVLDGIGVHVVSLASGVREEATVQALQALPEVEFAELDRTIRPSGITPNDPSYPYQLALPDISAPNAWSTTTGKSSI